MDASPMSPTDGVSPLGGTGTSSVNDLSPLTTDFNALQLHTPNLSSGSFSPFSPTTSVFSPFSKPPPLELEDVKRLRRENDFLKAMDPFIAVDMAMKIAKQRQQIEDLQRSRDIVAMQLEDVSKSLLKKSDVLAEAIHERRALERRLAFAELDQSENEALKDVLDEKSVLESRVLELEKRIVDLDAEIRQARSRASQTRTTTPTTPIPSFDRSDKSDKENVESVVSSNSGTAVNAPKTPSPKKATPKQEKHSDSHNSILSVLYKPLSQEPEDISKRRHDFIATLPSPSTLPADALKPIVIPSPFTLHEFLGITSGPLKSSLSGYRVFQEPVTFWSPQRDEHGYYLSPLFRCITNPRAANAHSWKEADVIGRMNKPTECFYHRENKWYYAGIYKAIRLEDLSPKEWNTLSDEAASAIIKETLVGRKNSTPATNYETSQLYQTGALKVACVALQCVGFNAVLYRTLIVQATKCQQSGKWKV